MSNKITILGSSGSKSEKGGSSAFMLNNEHVIDAGNLLSPLEEKSAKLETVWLTHSHLDHIIDIAYILDNYYAKREKTLNIFGLSETLEAVKKHFLNDTIWPDFSKIPLENGTGMSLAYHDIEVGKSYPFEEDGTIEAVFTEHTVPSCGYIIHKKDSGVIITADTYSLDGIVNYLSHENTIQALVVECSFPIRMQELARVSKHFTPYSLFEELKPLEGKDLNIYINHIKPAYQDEICAEIEEMKGSWNITILNDGDEIYF